MSTKTSTYPVTGHCVKEMTMSEKKHYKTSELLTMSDRTLNKSSDMSIKREEGVRRGVYLGLFLLFSAPIRIFI